MDWNALLSNTIKVNDGYCPSCRQAGNPKVHDENGWHYKCTTPGCPIGYYLPGSTHTEKRPTPAEAAAQDARIRQEVEDMMKNKIWIHKGNCSRMIPEGDKVPDGWSTIPTDL